MSVKQENGGLLPTCAIKQEAREDNNSGVNPTSRNATRPTFASPTISDVSMIQWPNRNGSRGSLAKGGDSPWPLYINDIAGRSISGNLASNRARFANTRRNTMPLLSPDSTSNFALIHQADSTFSLDHELIGPSPTPNFSSPRHSALFSGRKRPFSISPCSTGSLDLNALIRTSPSSLVAYVNNSRGSSAGSIGHLSPSLLVSNPITLQRIQSRLSRPVSKQRQSTADSDTSSAAVAVVKTEAQDVNKMMDSSELYCHSDRVVKSQLEAVAEENCSSENEDMITDHGTSESAVTESETERRDKPPRMKTKREYFSYPIHEEPHNNHCLWENCSEQFNSLDELVAHINSIHIYQESKKNFICRWQGCIRGCKEFKAQYMLLVHMRRHTGEKPHKCNFEGCEKAYSRLENLKTHLRSHTGERPYVCKFSCGKAFSNASDCAKHENRTHSNARPYVCKNNGCSKCYTDPSSLRKHMKTCTVSKKPKQEDTTGTEEESSNELNISTKTSMPKKTTKCRQKKRAAPPVLMKTNSNDFGYVSSDGGGVVHGFPEWSHPQSSGYDTEYNSWKSDQLPAGIVALQNGMLSPMSPQQTTNPPFVTSAVPPSQQYTSVTQPSIAPPPVYTVEQHPVPVEVKGNPPHYIIQSQPVHPQELANQMGYKSHTFPTLPNLPANRNMTHHYSIQVTNDSTAHRKLSETSSGISSLTAGSRNQSLRAVPVKAGHKYRKDSADSSFSTDRSSNASSFRSSLTGGHSIGQVPHSPYPSPPESRQSSQYGYSCSERSHPASWHGDSNGSTKQLYNGFNCDMNLINRRSSNGVNKTLRHHGSGMMRTKDYVQNLPHPMNTSGFSNVEPLPLPASMRVGAQSPVHGMEIGGMEPGGYVDQASPMQVSGDVPCSDVGCMVVSSEPLVKGTQPLCHLEPTQLPPPSYETSIHYKTFQHVSMEPSNHSNMMIGDMANMMYPSKGCYDNGARF